MSLFFGVCGSGNVPTPPPYEYPLDNIDASLIACAFACRKLRSAYSGYILRLRRYSDNAETDVGVNAVNEIYYNSPVSAGGSLGTWMGSDDIYLVGPYDQGTLGNDGMQSDPDSQPIFAEGGVLWNINSKTVSYQNFTPLVVANDASIQLDTSLSFFLVFNVSGVGAVGTIADKRDTGTGLNGYAFYFNNTILGVLWNSATTQYNASVPATINSGTPYALNMQVIKASTAKFYDGITQIDVTQNLNSSGSSVSNTDLLVGGNVPDPALTLDAYVGDFILLNSTISDVDREFIANNQINFYGL